MYTPLKLFSWQLHEFIETKAQRAWTWEYSHTHSFHGNNVYMYVRIRIAEMWAVRCKWQTTNSIWWQLYFRLRFLDSVFQTPHTNISVFQLAQFFDSLHFFAFSHIYKFLTHSHLKSVSFSLPFSLDVISQKWNIFCNQKFYSKN